MGLFDFLKKKETDVERYQRQLDQRRGTQPAPAAQESSGAALLQVEDTFSITGRGTVVVGKCTAAFAVGDEVIIENPDGSTTPSAVIGLEKFRAKIDRAMPGENVGVLLRGVSKQEVLRGAWIKLR